MTAGLDPVTTSTSLRHDRIALSPAGMQASLPAIHMWPPLHTAEMKWSSICVVTGTPLGWRGGGGALVAVNFGSPSVQATLPARGVPVMATTPSAETVALHPAVQAASL